MKRFSFNVSDELIWDQGTRSEQVAPTLYQLAKSLGGSAKVEKTAQGYTATFTVPDHMVGVAKKRLRNAGVRGI